MEKSKTDENEISCRISEKSDKQEYRDRRNINQNQDSDPDSAVFVRLIIWALCMVGLCNIIPVCLTQFYFRLPSATTLWFPEKLYSPGASVPIFYQNAGFEGWSVIGWSNFKCVNLPDEAHGVSSVNTRGNCILLYDKPNCEGRSLTLSPGGHSYDDLSLLEFDDVTRSIGPCL